MSFCSSQQRKIQHVCIYATKCKNGSKVRFKLNFAGVLSTMDRKEEEQQ